MQRHVRRFYLFKVLPYVQSRRWLRFCNLLLAVAAAISVFNIVMVLIMAAAQKSRCLLGAEAQWAINTCHDANAETMSSLGVTVTTIGVLMVPAVGMSLYATAVAPGLPLAFSYRRAVRVAASLYLVCTATACAVLFVWAMLWR